MKKNITKIAGFLLGVIVLLSGMGYIFKPIWFEWNNYDTLSGFYEQSDNSIEVIFLGSSHVINGITAMELYEDYGIMAYNLATEQQPMMMSYYWMLEAYSYHEDTLQVVVLDMSMMRKEVDSTPYKKAMLEMKNSINKLNAVKDYSNSLDDFISCFSTVFSYHTRWSALSEEDFSIIGYEANTYVRGYNFTMVQRIDTLSYTQVNVPTYIQTNTEDVVEYDEESLAYLEYMIEFCEENGIELVLTKVPVDSWLDEDNNTIAIIAEENNLEFYDFNYEPLIEEIELNGIIDYCDGTHLNYYGATKLTAWFGEYFEGAYDLTDVRNVEEYSFMEMELEKYKRYIFAVELEKTNDPCEYIELVNEFENFTIFITVQDEATANLTQDQRDAFEEIGLIALSELDYRGAYIGIIENGDVVYDEAINLNADVIIEEDLLLETKGTLSDGTSFELISGGGTIMKSSSCIIDGTEYSLMNRGINITVYDEESGEVVHSICFDTYESSTSTVVNIELALEQELENDATILELSGDIKDLYLYNLKCEDSYIVEKISTEYEEIGIAKYLDIFIDNENYVICINTQGEIEGEINEFDQENLEQLGLLELSAVSSDDLYLAIVDGGEVIIELKSDEADMIQYEELGYDLISVSSESDIEPLIAIDYIDYSTTKSGINVVIYNKYTELLVDSRVFSNENFCEK